MNGILHGVVEVVSRVLECSGHGLSRHLFFNNANRCTFWGWLCVAHANLFFSWQDFANAADAYGQLVQVVPDVDEKLGLTFDFLTDGIEVLIM